MTILHAPLTTRRPIDLFPVVRLTSFFTRRALPKTFNEEISLKGEENGGEERRSFGQEEFWTRSFRGEERRGDERILVLEERRMEEERRIEERRGEGSLEGRGKCRR